MKRLALLAVATLALPPAAPAKEPLRLPNRPSLSPDGATVVFDWGGDIWAVPTAGGTARPLTAHSGRDREPKFSPDGKQVAFVSDRTGSAQVFVVPAQGGAPKQLTHHTGGYAVQDWTADGQRLLVSGTRDHHWRRADRFFLISSSDRSGEQLLFDDYCANGSLSPDGTKLLFTREGTQWWRKGYRGSQASQVWMFDIAVKGFRKLLDHDRGSLWPVWKPDGRGFYFVGGQSGSFNLWEYDLASGETKQLTRFPDDSVVQPCVSRDGSTIVFRHLFDLYRLKPGNGEPEKIDISLDADRTVERTERRVLTTASHAAFTNDGLEIAFTAGGDLWVMDTELREPRRVTTSAQEEKYPVFSPEGDSILFVSDMNGQTDIWRAEREDKGKHWFQNTKFKLTQITKDGATKARLTWSLDGSKVAFLKNRGELWVMRPNGEEAKQLAASFSAIEFDWSPDGKWMAASIEDNDFNRDIFILPLDGSRPPHNVSRTPKNEHRPVWSPDGKLLAFTGQNAGTEVDVFYAWLKAEDAEINSRDRTVEKALDKINRTRRQGAGPGGRRPDPTGTPPTEERGTADAAAQPDTRTAGARRSRPDVVIDFERLHERVRPIPFADTAETDLFWSADGKRLLFTAQVSGQRATYSVEFPDELQPRQFLAATGSQARWLRSANQIVWLSNGVPSAVTVSAAGRPAGGAATTPTTPAPGGRFGRGGAGAPAARPPAASGDGESSGGGTAYRFQALQQVDVPARNAAIFDLAWRTIRDNFYDERLGNRDWNVIRSKYIDVAAQMPDAESVATVVQLMLGELNGSHLGFTPGGGGGGPGGPPRGPRRGTPAPAVPDEPATAGRWSEVTAHLGVRFDPAFAGPGIKVRDVLPKGPADQSKSRIEGGEVIVSIDGTAVDIAMDLTRVLNGPPARDLVLKVRAADGKERDVTLRPISFTAARSLLYDKWLADNRKVVEELSGGKLGYVHIDAMSMPSFYRFEKELYAAGHGKDGLVIDVRENGGGSTADHLLTALTQPVHAITVPRGGGPGYPHDRKVYATWTKPIIVMCNQNSFSNAEIFSHAIKTLNRGQLVGVPTAGGVISTGATTIMDAGTLRLPFRGWYTVGDGEDMELHGAVPQHVVWPQPGETKDAQIGKAVEVLLSDVQAWKSRPQPPLRKATERRQ